jgi:hypothetical protein
MCRNTKNMVSDIVLCNTDFDIIGKYFYSDVIIISRELLIKLSRMWRFGRTLKKMYCEKF